MYTFDTLIHALVKLPIWTRFGAYSEMGEAHIMHILVDFSF